MDWALRGRGGVESKPPLAEITQMQLSAACKPQVCWHIPVHLPDWEHKPLCKIAHGSR